MISRLAIVGLFACKTPISADCPTPTPGDGDRALVIADHTDQFDAGTLTIVDLDSHNVCDGVVTATADSVVHVANDDTIVEIGRKGFDRLRFFEPGNWEESTAEFSVGADSNPHDVAECGGAWWVSRYDSPLLRAYDLNGQQIHEIDLGPLADEDGIPEISDLLSDGQSLTAGLQRLDRVTDPSSWQTTGPGLAIRVDCEAASIVDTIEIPGNSNLSPAPGGFVAAGERQLVAASWSAPTRRLAEFPESVTAAAFTADGYGVSIGVSEDGWHLLRCLDPDGTTTDLMATDAYLPTLAANDRDEIWVGARRSYADPDAAPEGWPTQVDLGNTLLVIDPVQCAITDQVGTRLGAYSLAFY